VGLNPLRGASFETARHGVIFEHSARVAKAAIALYFPPAFEEFRRPAQGRPEQ
jgi:hypothetical protein